MEARNRITVLKELAKAFFAIGTFSVGGGYAMLPLLERELIEKRGWLDEPTLLDYFAIGQSTPGIIAINTATMVGYTQAGILGSLVATGAMIVVPTIIIMVIATFFTQFASNIIIIKAFAGIRVMVVVLIANSLMKMGRTTLQKPLAVIFMLGVFGAIAFGGLNPIIPIVLAPFFALGLKD